MTFAQMTQNLKTKSGDASTLFCFERNLEETNDRDYYGNIIVKQEAD
jgi:hypothetical protein